MGGLMGGLMAWLDRGCRCVYAAPGWSASRKGF
jgi:hypothetical protein